jgi:hypothetical protein
MRRLTLSICGAGALLSLAGCSGGGDDDGRAAATATPTATAVPSPSPTGTPGTVPTPSAPSYAWIRENVLQPSCSGAECHSPEHEDADLMTYEKVVNAPTQEGPCGEEDRIRVVPGNLEESTLYLKVTDPPCGERMPYGRPPLPAETISEIERWILAGAPEGEAAE